MARERLYREWQPTELLPARMTVVEARDIVLDCFHTMHGPHFEQTKSVLGVNSEDHRVRQSVKGMVRLAFKSVEGSYDHPTRDDLLKVIDYLGEKSRSWGTPDEVVDRQAQQLMRVIARVQET